ncbi:E3 ubiquitin ligase family protein [Candidatus Vondammii sp. HM_W22]|uniref:E3 ubiquitin ligase family protein n=1 Tax=Candidatus Vondammii sp. HM_W22 TaxID=2687299 RepID=UPI001F13614B|nr:E3 ubiquitin ligase family protein [Candidatus Vondammii sp. HM_W22]
MIKTGIPLESNTSDQLFLLRDKTGDCIINPEGAEVTPNDRSIGYGHARYPSNKKPMRSIPQLRPLFRLAKLLNTPIGLTGRHRYTEERIYTSDTLYAIGHFKSLDEMGHTLSQ